MSASSPADELNASTGSSQPGSPTAGTLSGPGAIACVACESPNPAGGQFCASCGHGLFEPCQGCGKPVSLTQSFCGNCGCDLVASVKQRTASYEQKIADAIAAAKEHNFERSRILLSQVEPLKDFRFREVVTHAKLAQSKIRVIAETESESASDRMEAAERAYAAGDAAGVVALLSPLSKNLLSPKAAQILARSQTLLEQVEQTQQAIQAAFAKRDWAAAGTLLDRMLELLPDDEACARLASKVGKKLVSRASKLRDSHKYGAAHSMLESVPVNSRDAEYETLRKQVDQVQWLSSQFVGEPFATPVLGRIAKRWVEKSDGSPDARAMLDLISRRIKEPRDSPRDLHPTLNGPTRSWIGGTVGVLAFPTCVRPGNDADLRSAPSQFNVAIGLALQGIGRARVNEDFAPKKGLLKRIGRKKSAGCWGIDIGSFGLKAVYLQPVEGGVPEVVHTYQESFPTPLSRTLSESKTDECIREAVQRFLQTHDVGVERVWVSFVARELVSRFVRLPPVDDKQAALLLEKEIEQRIPLPLDEVACVRWIAPLAGEESSFGRAAFASAAKKEFVGRYLENLQHAGLEVAGLQAAPLALLNFAAEELDDQIVARSAPDDSVSSLGKSVSSEGKLPTVAIVDCGAESTTFLLVCENSCWFWSFEEGGASVTRAICRATKTSHNDGEKIKRNPAQLENPVSQYETIENRMETLNARLTKVLSDTLREHGEFSVTQTWCCGGGSRTHGWIRRVLCEA